MSGDAMQQHHHGHRAAAALDDTHAVDSKSAHTLPQEEQREQSSDSLVNTCDRAQQSARRVIASTTTAVEVEAAVATVTASVAVATHAPQQIVATQAEADAEEKAATSATTTTATDTAFASRDQAATHTTTAMALRIDTTVGRRRLSPHAHYNTSNTTKTNASTPPRAAGNGAPPVWISPDWATYPIIENYYGQPRRSRVNSCYEVMCSPTTPTPTTTLGANCCAYDDCDDRTHDNTADDRTFPSAAAVTGRIQCSDSDAPHATAATTRRRKCGSFAYSCSTETSDDNDMLSSPFAAAKSATIEPPPTSASGGFAAWNRRRRTAGDPHDLVPVPHGAKSSSAFYNYVDLHPHPPTSRFGNPQAGSTTDSPVAASSPTTSRLRTKLLDALAQIDARIASERTRFAHARQQQQHQSRTTKRAQRVNASTSAVWSLFCGVRPFERTATDGLDVLYDELRVACHTRALNQLQRHRRHVYSILQIVTAHNPDLALTEKQLDSFESADAMLANDIVYSTLQQQVAALASKRQQRPIAHRQATARNGSDCLERPHVKAAMLAKLLEAVSWYRLVQSNAREEAASTSVSSSRNSAVDNTVDASTREELQVEKILSVLAGEDFYADYSDLMASPAWWDLAQAHFETLVFATPDSRVCQWLHRLSRDVALASFESLDEDADDAMRRASTSKTSARLANDRRSAATTTSMSSIDASRSSRNRETSSNSNAHWTRDPQPEQLLEFVDRVTRRIRREFNVAPDVSTSLDVFVQRAVYPRLATLCYAPRVLRECQRKDKLWRKRCTELSGLAMEQLNVPPSLATTLRSQLPSRRVRGYDVFFTRAIDAFNRMNAIVPCDLLDELLHGVVILHHEAALVLGTTQFSVETFFPLLAYVLLHCRLPRLHAQLHLLETFAITDANVNGEASYYVYCVHAAVEYVCNSAGLVATAAAATACAPTPSTDARDNTRIATVTASANASPTCVAASTSSINAIRRDSMDVT